MIEQKEKKHLEMTAHDYDLLNDSLFFYKEGEKYRSSLEFKGIILDFGEDNYIINLEMLDVSEKFHISKSDLINLRKFDATIEINEENVKVTMKIELLKRNKVYDKCIEAITPNILNLPSGTQGIGVTIEALT